MDKDKFSLGNFDDMDSSLADASPSAEASEDRSADRHIDDLGEDSSEEVSRSEKKIDTDVIEHPSVKAKKQADFRSPLNNAKLTELALDQIVPNEFQPRRIFNEEKLQELADSIRLHGIIQPLVVVARSDGRYEIVVGERRFRASKIAGLEVVPVFIREKISNQTKLELALIENVQRADLNPIEEAKAYQQLYVEFKLQVNQISERVGKSSSAISNLMRLLKLPAEIQRALVEEEISEGQARPLLSLRDNEEIMQMFEIIKRSGMKVRDIENKVREIRRRKIKVKEMFKPDPFLDSLENLLRSKLGTRVAVNRSAKGGRITIEFYSDEELNEIVDKIS